MTPFEPRIIIFRRHLFIDGKVQRRFNTTASLAAQYIYDKAAVEFNYKFFRYFYYKYIDLEKQMNKETLALFLDYYKSRYDANSHLFELQYCSFCQDHFNCYIH